MLFEGRFSVGGIDSNRDRRSMVWFGTLLSLVVSTGVSAQAVLANASPAAAPETASDSTGLPQIIVTAEKREQGVNSIPATVSAFSAADLAQQGITSTQDLQLVTPGVTFTSDNGIAEPFARGIGFISNQIATESPLALYVDGVYRPALYGGFKDLDSSQRVEVLLGPQGTLYGRNSTAGAINIVTRDPSADTVANASVSYGNYDSVVASAYVSGGTDTAAAGVSVLRDQNEGIMRNLFDGSRVNDNHLTSVRGKIRLTPWDSFSATLAFDYTRQSGRAGSAYTYLPSQEGRLARPLPTLAGGLVVQDDPRATYADPAFTYQDVDDWGGGLTLRKQFDLFDLVSITGGSGTLVRGAVDLSASTLAIESNFDQQSQHTISQELQAVSTRPVAGFNWIVGGYWYHSKAGFDYLNLQTPAAVPAALQLDGHQKTDALAAYGQLTYELSASLKATAGVRYSTERKTLLSSNLRIPEFDLTTTTPQQGQRWSKATPELNLAYTLGGSLFYFRFSDGFKSGNFNVLGLGAPPVNPEEVKAYELGGKHSIAAQVQINWSVFHYDYTNLQVATTVENGSSELENAKSARITGADGTLQWAVGHGLELRMGASYLHARYTDYDSASVYFPDPATGGYGNALGAANVDGNTMTRAPTATGNAGLIYAIPTALGRLSLSGTYFYSSSFYFDAGNTIRQPAYGLLNSRVELQVNPGHPLTFFLFCNNLTDKNVLSAVEQVGLGNLAQYDNPRFFGGGIRTEL